MPTKLRKKGEEPIFVHSMEEYEEAIRDGWTINRSGVPLEIEHPPIISTITSDVSAHPRKAGRPKKK